LPKLILDAPKPGYLLSSFFSGLFDLGGESAWLAVPHELDAVGKNVRNTALIHSRSNSGEFCIALVGLSWNRGQVTGKLLLN
jgi:hypothetical protein